MTESVKEMIALIDQIAEEHRTTLQRTQSLENVANDVEALSGLQKSADTFVPERLDAKQSLHKMQELLEKITEGLNDHFYREETRLLTGFEKWGDERLASALHALLDEHRSLRDRFIKTQEHVSELVLGKMGRHRWRATAQDMRAYLSETTRQLEKHAYAEQELLLSLRKQLVKEL